MKIIEKIKNSLLQKNKLSKEEFLSSIRYLYSVNKIKISEFENNTPTFLKILNLLEEKGRCWNNIEIDEEKTVCFYNEEKKSFIIEIFAKQRGKDMLVHIFLENKKGTYSDITCEEMQRIFDYAFVGTSEKDFITYLKGKIKKG